MISSLVHYEAFHVLALDPYAHDHFQAAKDSLIQQAIPEGAVKALEKSFSQEISEVM
jgi:hypothetical protein